MSFLDPDKENLFGKDTISPQGGNQLRGGGSPFSERNMKQNMDTNVSTEEEIGANLTFGETLWDILAGTGSGLVAGASFGLVDLYDPKSSVGKITHTFGDVAGIMLPFGGINKATRAAMQFGRRSTRGIVKQTAEKQANKLVSKGLSQEHGYSVVSRLEKATYDVTGGRLTGARGAFDFGATKAAKVVDDIGAKARAELGEVFAKSGIPKQFNNKRFIDEVVTNFQNGLRAEGRHINTIGQWVTRNSKWLEGDVKWKKNVAKYLTMAADEVIAMNIFGHISATINKSVKGEEYNPGMVSLHSTIIGAGFPAIRGIFKGGGSGSETWSKWYNSVVRQYEKVSYKDLVKRGDTGVAAVKAMIKSASGGIKNSPIKGLEINTGKRIINLSEHKVLDSLSKKELVTVANAIRKNIIGKSKSNYLRKVWGPDMAKSMPRMVAGGVFNNTISLVDGHFWHLEPEDQFAHFMLGMFFTRGRGHWNHSWEPAPAISDYYKAAKHLSGGVSGMEKMLKYQDHLDSAHKYGGALSSAGSSRAVYEVMEKYRGQKGVKDEPFDATTENKMPALEEMHYVLDLFSKNPADPVDFQRFNWRYVPKDARRNMLEELNNIRVSTNEAGRDLYFRDVDMPTFKDIVTINIGEGNEKLYGDFFSGLTNHGIPMRVLQDGTMIFPRITIDKQYRENYSFDKLTGLMSTFVKMGKAKEGDRVIDIKDIMPDKETVKRFDEYVESHKESLIENNLGPDQALTGVKNLDFFENQYIVDIVNGKNTKSLMKLYDIFDGNIKHLSKKEQSFAGDLKTWFDQSGKVIDGFKFLVNGKEQNVNDVGLHREDYAYIDEFLQIHSMYSKGKSKKDYKQPIEIADAKVIVEQYRDIINPMPEHLIKRGSMSEQYMEYLGNRVMGEYVSPEKFFLFDQLKTNNEIWFDKDSNSFEVSSVKAKKDQVERASGSSKEAHLAGEMWSEILSFMGTSNGRLRIVDKDYGDIQLPGGTVGSLVDNVKTISEIYMTIPKSYNKQVEQLVLSYKETLAKDPKNNEIDVTRSPLWGHYEDIKVIIDSFARGEEVSIDQAAEILKKIDLKASTAGEKKLVKQIGKTIADAMVNRKTAEEAMNEVIHDPFTGEPINLSLAFNTMIESDVNGMNKLNNVITSLIGMGQRPETRMDALRLQLKMKLEMSKILNIDLAKTEMTINDMIYKMKHTQGYSSVRHVVDFIKNSIAQSSSWDVKLYDSELYTQSRDFFKSKSFAPTSRNLNTVAKYYFVDNPITGEAVDSKVITAFTSLRETHIKQLKNQTNNLELAVRLGETEIFGVVKSRINSDNSLSSSEKMQRIAEFESSGYFEMYNMISSQVSRPQVSHKGGDWLFESDVLVTRGPRDIVFEHMNRNGVDTDKIVEVNETVVVGGRSVDISQVNANDLLKMGMSSNVKSAEVNANLKRGNSLEEGDIPAFVPINVQNAVIVHTGPGKPLMIETSPKMMTSMGDLVKLEYNKIIDQIKVKADSQTDIAKANETHRVRQNFKDFFEDLVNAPTTQTNLHHKFTMYYWARANRPMFLEQFQPGTYGNLEGMRSFYDKFYKRLKLYEGGGFKPLDRTNLVNLARNHPDPKVKTHAQKELDDGIQIMAMKDEGEGSHFLAKNSIVERLESQRDSEPNPDVKASIDKMINDIRPEENGLYESLDGTSRLNSIAFIGEGRARILAANEGKDFDPAITNGWKPILQFTNPSTGEAVFAKTWLVYDPKNKQLFKNKDVDIMLTGSAAKHFEGLDVATGTNMATMFEPQSSNWRSELNSISNTQANVHKVAVNSESLLQGFSNHENQGVVSSKAIYNLLNAKATRETRKWQKFDELLDELDGMSKNLQENAKREIADALFDFKKEDDNYSILSPQQSLAENLLKMNIRTDSRLIKDVVSRFFASKALNLLRRPKNKRGTSTYLVTDVLPNNIKLDVPAFKQWDNIDSKGMFKHIEGRDKVHLGGHAESHAFGELPVVSSNNIRFVARIGGIDVPFMSEGKSLSVKYVNQFDSYYPHHNAKINKPDTSDPNNAMRISRLKMQKKHAAMNKKTEPMMKEFIDHIQDQISGKMQIGKMSDVYSHLKRVREGLETTGNKKLDKFIQDSKVEIMNMVNPIPRKGADFTSVRVQHILDKDYGNQSQANDYDLAVTLQRDFDADHLYSYSDMPFENVKHNFFIEGLNPDVTKFETEPGDFNPFGVDYAGTNLKAGKLQSSNGVRAFKNLHITKKMSMGKMIKYTGPLGWADNLGLKIATDTKGDFQKMNFIPKEDPINSPSGLLARLENVTQATVDAFGGEKVFLKFVKNVDEYIMFGTVPSGVKLPREFHEYQPIFKLPTQTADTNPRVHMESIKEVLNIMSRTDAVFNDVYDVGMSRSLDRFDVRVRYNELAQIFGDDANYYVMQRLLKRHYKDKHYQEEIIKTFTGITKGGTYSSLKIGEIIKKAITGEKIAIRRVFDFDSLIKNNDRDLEQYFGMSNSGRAIHRLHGNKFWQRDDSQHWPAGKSKTEVVDHSRSVYKSIQLLRVLGIEPEQFTGDNAFIANVNQKFATPGAIRGHEKRNVAYSYYQNKFEDVSRRLHFLEGNRNNNVNEVTELQQKLADYATAMRVMEETSIREFGEEITGNLGTGSAIYKQHITGNGTNKSPSHYTNRERGWQHVYKINGKPGFDLSKNQEAGGIIHSSTHGFNADKNIQFISSVRSGDRVVLQNNSTYVVLKRPIIGKYMSEKDVIHDYSWFFATADAKLTGIAHPSAHDALTADIMDYRMNLSHDLSKRIDIFKDPAKKVFARDANMEANIADQYNTARLFKAWARNDDGSWNQNAVDRFAILLLAPEAIPKTYVHADNTIALPNFRQNKRVATSVLQFLTNEGLVSGKIQERLEYQSVMVDYIERGIDPGTFEAPWRANNLEYDNYFTSLEKFGDGRKFIVDVLQDQFSPFRNTMGEYLTSQNIFHRTDPYLVNLLGGQTEPQMRVFQVRNFRGLVNQKLNVKRKWLCE